ncbi:unnamed protein product [Trichogramma brassicae]|uniref:Reverse transcriptase domain-containing protein n=1 Tax=Trichogramma brassicae TaxID=86971 RepID=A0A6H5J827_9HYME|nr:unnamed protein product [Trichogramma brassicae]
MAPWYQGVLRHHHFRREECLQLGAVEQNSHHPEPNGGPSLSATNSVRALEFTTDDGAETYEVTAGVPQGPVLGPILWNVMYDRILRLKLPRSAKIVGFADDIAVTVVAKHLDLVEFYKNETIRLVRAALTDLGQQTVDQKTEVLLVTSRKVRETFTLRAGDHYITSAPCIRYLGVHIDARLRFDEHLRIVSDKANRVAGALLGIMPNIGGPRSSRRRLYASVVTLRCSSMDRERRAAEPAGADVGREVRRAKPDGACPALIAADVSFHNGEGDHRENNRRSIDMEDKLKRMDGGDTGSWPDPARQDQPSQGGVQLPELGKVLGTAATASALLHTSMIEIKDLDECDTKEEVTMALDALLGIPVSKRDPVKSLRKAYAGTQGAVVAIPDDLAATALKLGHVQIGWVNCRIRAREEAARCYPLLESCPRGRSLQGSRPSSAIDAARRATRQRTAKANHHAFSAKNEELTTIVTRPQARAVLLHGRSLRTANDENPSAQPQSLRGCPGPALRYHQQAAHRRGHPVGCSEFDMANARALSLYIKNTANREHDETTALKSSSEQHPARTTACQRILQDHHRYASTSSFRSGANLVVYKLQENSLNGSLLSTNSHTTYRELCGSSNLCNARIEPLCASSVISDFLYGVQDVNAPFEAKKPIFFTKIIFLGRYGALKNLEKIFLLFFFIKKHNPQIFFRFFKLKAIVYKAKKCYF